MTSTPGSVARSFDMASETYDALRRSLVPGFDLFYGNALEVIADWRTGGPWRVLDLGAGTGLFSAMVQARFPEATFHLVDVSPDMLAQARTRFAGQASAVSIEVGDFAAGAIGGPWDLVISALAIHHLADEDKRALFARIHDGLVAGGLFVNAEQVDGPTPAALDRYRRVWDRQVRAAGVSDDEHRRTLDRMRLDRCSTVRDQLDWLRQAGFAEADCTFKAWRFAVLAAWKA